MNDFMKSLIISTILLALWTAYLFVMFTYGADVLHAKVTTIDIACFFFAECVGILVWVLYVIGSFEEGEGETSDDDM
jgi:hypothetical protein